MQIEERSDGVIATVGRKVLAWTVLVVAAIVLLKIVGAIVLGFVYTVLTIAAVIGVVFALWWASKRL
jgi:hypothetical protein